MCFFGLMVSWVFGLPEYSMYLYQFEPFAFPVDPYEVRSFTRILQTGKLADWAQETRLAADEVNRKGRGP